MKSQLKQGFGLALLTVLGACASPNKNHDNNLQLREEVLQGVYNQPSGQQNYNYWIMNKNKILQGVYNQPSGQQTLDRELYANALTNETIPLLLTQKAQILYPNASGKDIQEFLEARKDWYKVAHECYPKVIEGKSPENKRAQFITATMHLMREHSDLFSGIQRQTVQQSYAGIIDLVYFSHNKK